MNTNINLDNNATNLPAKKQWQKPELYILDTDDVNAKNIASRHEGNYKSSHAKPGSPGVYSIFLNGGPLAGWFPNKISNFYS